MANRRAKEQAGPVSTVQTPINHERLRQIYSKMRGRSFVVSFLPVGPVVGAETPEELVEAPKRAIVEAAKSETPT